jgi:hypothetical protein
MLPSVLEISSRIHYLLCFGRLAYHPTPALTLCASPDLSWVLAAPLGVWYVAPTPLSAFAAFPVFHWEFGAECLAPCPTPVLQGRFSIAPPSLLLVLDYSSLFMFFSFAWGGFSLSRGCAGLFSWGVGRGVMHGAYLFCSFTQAALEPAGKEKWCCFFHYGKVYWLGIQDITESDSDWCSVFCYGSFFPRAGHALPVGLRRIFVAVSCN